jgi:hypothetical protein
MILSRGRRFAFVHIPKTGGTSLALALEARALADDILIGDTPKARARARRWKGVATAGRVWKHSALADVIGLVTWDELAAMQVVTLVRNPWARALSYYHWLRVQRFAHPAVGIARATAFPAFLRHPQISAAFRMWPAGAYLRQADGREAPALFLRLEHLDADLPAFEAHLGFRLALPHVNRSDRPVDWRGAYDDAGAQHLADLCAEDIARFGYRFDP